MAAALSAMASFGPAGGYAKALPQEHASQKREYTHGPHSRGCWDKDHDINTDYALNWPDTGKVVEVRCWVCMHWDQCSLPTSVSPQYQLEITNTTGAPDGFERLLMLVNGQFPGPTIQAGVLLCQLKNREISRPLVDRVA